METELKQVLRYNKTSGEFKWKASKKKAGYVNARGYWEVKYKGKRYPAHRLAFFLVNGEWPSLVVDHKNGNKIDNRWINLRLCTVQENTYNSKIPKHNTSGFKGVTFHKPSGKWWAHIKKDGKRISLGYYSNAREAARAYNKKARELRGEFAKVNPNT